jgi:hypothetical protein
MTYISSEDLFEMDECMKELIILLNKNGYATKYCCSGHPYQPIWKYTLINQETYFNFLHQFNFKDHPKSSNGYIWFKRKKDRDFVFDKLKKTKHGHLFFNYTLSNDKEPTKQQIRFIKKLNKHWIEFRHKGLSQEKINDIWKDFTISFKKGNYKNKLIWRVLSRVF